jgi:N-terminal acetyltransferase B complex non-catalytic subunit
VCKICDSPTSRLCIKCLRKIILDASAAYKDISGDKEVLDAIPSLDKDPRVDLALAMGFSLLKLSGLQPRGGNSNIALWDNIEPAPFLQAVMLLDAQLRTTPGNTELRVLLVKLYLLLGCASYAYKLWQPLDVKRTIQDALSPLFFDRISMLSPGLFHGARPPMEPLRTYFNYTLADGCPVRIWEAFAAGSYPSILDMVDYDDKLRRSCTMMMTLVEERRAMRCFGGKIDFVIGQHPLASM